jgi:hypothetical protein
MTPSLTSLDSLLITIVLITMAIGLPILMVLSIRFLWARNLNLGHSKQIEKLIWQLHRIASAAEHQMHLSFPAVQPGTEEPRDLAYLQQIAAPSFSTQSGATPAAAAQQPVISPPSSQQESALPPLQTGASGEAPHRGGVNSMFDL